VGGGDFATTLGRPSQIGAQSSPPFGVRRDFFIRVEREQNLVADEPQKSFAGAGNHGCDRSFHSRHC
jgi:hypothetical protein